MAAKWTRSYSQTDYSSDSVADSSLNNNRCRVGWFRTSAASDGDTTDTAARPWGIASGSLAAGCKLSEWSGKWAMPK